jgi:leader peptidase (prepilin peptidase)/N-methyltransferase
MLPIALLIAAVAAMLVTGLRAARGGAIDRRSPLPFGAFLAPAIWLTFVLDHIDLIAA